MRHNFAVEGHAFRLRPVERPDAAFILELRTDSRRNRYLHRGATDLATQQRWLDCYFTREGDYYFIIENMANSQPEGTVGIYNVDRQARTAEWGRWVVRAGSLAALESACLIYTAGFELLDLDEIYCRTILENASVVAFHDSFGVRRRHILRHYFERDGVCMDAVEGCLTRARWNFLRDNTLAKAARVATWSFT